MKAILLREPYVLELVEIPRPKLTSPEQVLIEVSVCGICGSDLRYYAGENPWALHTLGRHVDNPLNMLLGHEFSGVVVEVASRQHEHLLGRRVGAQAFRTCGTCATSVVRATRTSAEIRCISVTRRGGGRCPSILVPTPVLHRLGRFASSDGRSREL